MVAMGTAGADMEAIGRTAGVAAGRSDGVGAVALRAFGNRGAAETKAPGGCLPAKGGHDMKYRIVVLSLALIFPVAGGASAQQPTAPGQHMQDKGSAKGSPGASGYAPR